MTKTIAEVLGFRRVLAVVATAVAFCGVSASIRAGEPAPSASYYVDIPSQDLRSALQQLATASHHKLLYRAALVTGKVSQAIRGNYTAEEAIQKVLAGTDLTFEITDDSVVLIRDRQVVKATGNRGVPERALNLTQMDQTSSMQKVRARLADAQDVPDMPPQSGEERPGLTQARADSGDPDSSGTPEILVTGRRSLNAGIERTRDDLQPYVIFSHEDIERSSVSMLEEFLKTRLPMNASDRLSNQYAGSVSAGGRINLRGLGETQTLILIDGRRMPGVSSGGAPSQTDINGIPMAAVERIEVLPSTAGGIYGGSATGGVINIVMRREYRGIDAKVTYANTFDTDAGSRRVDLSGGFSLEGGRTQVTMAGSYSDANNLAVGDRDFAARSRALQLKNNPGVAAFTTAGSPPAGATANIRSSNGSPLTLDDEYGGDALISSVTGQPANFTHIPLGYAGVDSDSAQALLDNAGTYNLDLPDDINGLQRGLLAVQSIESASLNVRRSFTDWLQVFVDASSNGSRITNLSANVPSVVTSLPAGAPNNPFKQAINVNSPVPGWAFPNRFANTTVRTMGGLIFSLPHQWTSSLEYSWSRSRTIIKNTNYIIDAAGQTSLNTGQPAADGRPALDILQEQNTHPLDYTPYLLPMPNLYYGPSDMVLEDASWRISGPVLQLPGGPLRLAGLIERREEIMEDAVNVGPDATTRLQVYRIFGQRSQRVQSWYLEGTAPLVSGRNARRGIQGLELQASVRGDEYRTLAPITAAAIIPSRDTPFPDSPYAQGEADSTDYTLAMKYTPTRDVALRASIGTGFLPPSILQVAPQDNPAFTRSLANDPLRGFTPMVTPFELVSGSSSSLQPESSRATSAGVILTPAALPGLRVSLDYTRIRKAREIQSAPIDYILANPDLFPGRVVRGEKLTGDPADWAGPVTYLDASLVNLAKTEVVAYDLQADYTFRTTRLGDFHGYMAATRQTHYLNQTLPISPEVEFVGFSGGPLEWRGNFGLNWEHGPLTVGWNAQYYDAYRVYTATASAAARADSVLNQGSATIPSQMYHDLDATYRLDAATFTGSFWADVEISAGVQNIFNTSPPILAATSVGATAGYSSYGDPRLRRYTLSLRKSFR